MHLHIRPIGLHLNAFTPWVWVSAGSVGRFSVSLGRSSGLTAALHIGSNRWLNYRLGADWEDRIVWQRGPFMLTRMETTQEREEREQFEEQLYNGGEWYCDAYEHLLTAEQRNSFMA